MGGDMIDETPWQRNIAVSLTACWSWDETWLMRLPGKEIKQCHSQPVGHRIRHHWWDSLAPKYSSVTHSLLVMGWDMIDETPWQRNKSSELLTACWSWDAKTWWDFLWWNYAVDTHPLSAMRWNMMRLPGTEQMWCYSLSIYGQQNYLGFNAQNGSPAHSLIDQMCETQLGKVCNKFTSCHSFFTSML